MFMKFGLLGLLSQVLFLLSLVVVGTWLLFKLLAAVWPWLVGIAVIWGIYKLMGRKAKA